MIENAIVKSTMLGREDHSIPTCFLHLEGAGWRQSFGGYDLRHGDCARRWVFDLPAVLGAASWEDLPGTVCRIEHDDAPGSARKILRVGHVVEDRWFDVLV